MKILWLFLIAFVSFASYDHPYPPEILRGCQQYTSTPHLQKLCLELRVPLKVARGCRHYTSTYYLEELCLKLKISPERTKDCKRYTTTFALEEHCLREAASHQPPSCSFCGR